MYQDGQGSNAMYQDGQGSIAESKMTFVLNLSTEKTTEEVWRLIHNYKSSNKTSTCKSTGNVCWKSLVRQTWCTTFAGTIPFAREGPGPTFFEARLSWALGTSGAWRAPTWLRHAVRPHGAGLRRYVQWQENGDYEEVVYRKVQSFHKLPTKSKVKRAKQSPDYCSCVGSQPELKPSGVVGLCSRCKHIRDLNTLVLSTQGC